MGRASNEQREAVRLNLDEYSVHFSEKIGKATVTLLRSKESHPQFVTKTELLGLDIPLYGITCNRETAYLLFAKAGAKAAALQAIAP